MQYLDFLLLINGDAAKPLYGATLCTLHYTLT